MTGREPATDAELNEAAREVADAAVAMYEADAAAAKANNYDTGVALMAAHRRLRAAVQEYLARTQSREDKP